MEASVSGARERNDEGLKEREQAERIVVGCREKRMSAGEILEF